MGRLFVYMAIAATALGLVMLMPAADPREAGEAARSLLPTLMPAGAGWVAGLVTGLGLSWIARFDWRSIPERLALWARLLRHRLWWMVCGGLCAGFLLFF
ncbi:MAG: hypothetical protein EKK41_28970 [Hyphomicrobiales bacterium]|nr:MAG: hypothetical protein EKK41_28970 [Hyphomicrobiales bacterium]